MVQDVQGSLGQVEDTSQEVRHTAYQENHQVPEDHHDPIQPAEEDKKVGIEDVDRMEVRLEEVGLAVGDLAEGLVCCAEDLEVEL